MGDPGASETAGRTETDVPQTPLGDVERLAQLQIRLDQSEARASWLEAELASIHGSRMWRAWLWTIAIRRILILPFRRRWD